jgi:hypothetical protein
MTTTPLPTPTARGDGSDARTPASIITFVRWVAMRPAARAPQAMGPASFDRGGRPGRGRTRWARRSSAARCRRGPGERRPGRGAACPSGPADHRTGRRLVAAVIEDQAEPVAVKGVEMVTATMGRMLGQWADTGRLFVGREPVPGDTESAAGERSRGGRNCGRKCGLRVHTSAPEQPRRTWSFRSLTTPTTRPPRSHRDRVRVVGVVALVKGRGGAGQPRGKQARRPAKDAVGALAVSYGSSSKTAMC